MDAKAPTSSYHSHTETRLSLDSTGSAIVCIQLPSTSTFARTSKASRKVVSALPNNQNEEDYQYRRVASSSGVFFRSGKRYPRSILWRCLEENQVVELRSLDLSKSHDESREKEADLVLRIGFPSAIAKDSVAIADSEEDDSISLFVLATSNDLYTITLKSVLFCKATASEDDFDRFVKIYKPASLSIASAFRLTATSAHELFISLGDGRLLRLVRKSGHDGSSWDETAYSDAQWTSSLRGLIRWSAGSNTVTYNGASLDHATALGMAISPGQTHLLCVGLNHTLKIWNLKSGKASIRRDILDIEREPSEIQKILIHPSTPKIIDTFECLSGFDGDLYYLVTFSPHSSGVFKFWGIRDPDSAEHGIRDLFEDDILRAPEPDDGAIWTLADFHISTQPRSSNIDVWIMMKLNRRYKIYNRRFLDLQSLGGEWSNDWSVILIDPGKDEPLNETPLKISDLNAESISERWLNYILTPGRYSEAVLETALAIYVEGRKLPSQRNNRSLIRERISSLIGSLIHLSTSQSDTAVERFQDELSNEWISFWKTINDVDHLHWEPLTLGFDQLEDTPYTIYGGGFSVIRELSELEILAYNTSEDLQRNQDLSLTRSIEMDGTATPSSTIDQLAAIVEGAARFRASFSNTLKASAQFSVQNELWKDPVLPVPERIQEFYDDCEFGTEIGDRVYNNIISSLKSYEGLAALRTDAVLTILDSLSNVLPSQSEERSVTNQGTRIGMKVLSQGIRDSLVVQDRVLTDLLYLIIFFSIEGDEEDLLDQLDSDKVFSYILDTLKSVQILRWLALNTINVTTPHTSTSAASITSVSPVSPISILEQDFIPMVHPRAAISQSQSAALTQSIRDVQTFVCGGNEVGVDEVLFNIQCIFLRENHIDLASSFIQFQPSTAWGTYIRGRVHLIKQEFMEAALYFKKAAFKLARAKHIASNLHLRSGTLIGPVEEELFGSGFPNFYTHIISLFSPYHAHGQIQAFAELALQHSDAPNLSQRSELLSRLFHASLAIMDHSVAYAALSRYADKVLQRLALAELITRMVSHGYIKELLSLPFTTLKKDVEEILSTKAFEEIDLPITTTTKTPYFKILYAFHIRHKNIRAAASVLLSRLESRHARRLSKGKQPHVLHNKEEAEKALDEYLVGINALALLGREDDSDAEDEAWIFVEDKREGNDDDDASQGGQQQHKKRRVMRIEEMRIRFQAEMDRITAIELGRWGIVDEDDEDEEDEDSDEDGMNGVERTAGALIAV